jgi:lipopolysaccharide transport system ATP-binding protein
MSDVIIQVEEISKLYRLGTIGTGHLRQDVHRWWQQKILKKNDSFFKMDTDGKKESSDYIWALKNVSFEVNQGDVYGVIGRNGSGKSTLLKILSRIIRPTKGTVRGRGKVNSLLEIGTGFHPELSGRENIYISGHMLGMNRWEIKKKYDEIVDFSGIEKFLNTPVKRYSSGMYVRLAFAVAAHMEPDILIVDEVLAVGDSEFQKKCMGKMKDVSTDKGRTIIFVSHSMQSVNMLCTKALWLQKGSISGMGDTQTVIHNYLVSTQNKVWKQEWNLASNVRGNKFIKVLSVELIPDLPDYSKPIDILTPLTFKFTFSNLVKGVNLMTCLHLFTLEGECVFDVCAPSIICDEGIMNGEWLIPGNTLSYGAYYFSVMFVRDTTDPVYYLEECVYFDVEDYRAKTNHYHTWQGYLHPKLPFKLTNGAVKQI